MIDEMIMADKWGLWCFKNINVKKVAFKTDLVSSHYLISTPSPQSNLSTQKINTYNHVKIQMKIDPE